MLEGLATVTEGDRLLPFVRHFYGSRSAYLWEDETGETHLISGEGRDQAPQFGDAPSSDGGSGATQTCGANLRFSGRRVRSRKGWKQLSASSQRSCGHTLRSKCMMEKPSSQPSWRGACWHARAHHQSKTSRP